MDIDELKQLVVGDVLAFEKHELRVEARNKFGDVMLRSLRTGKALRWDWPRLKGMAGHLQHLRFDEPVSLKQRRIDIGYLYILQEYGGEYPMEVTGQW